MTFIPNRRYDLLIPDDPNYEGFSKYGALIDVDPNEAPIDIYSGAELDPSIAEYQFSSVAGAWSISSTDAGDTQVVRILRLIDDFEIDVINVTLTGQTPAALPGNTIRVLKVNNASGLVSGSPTDFAGDVYMYEGSSATGGVPDTITDLRAYIPAGATNSWSAAIVTVPADFTFFVGNIPRSMNKDSGGGADREANFEFKTRPQGGVFFESVPFSVTNKDGGAFVFDPARPLGPRSDLVVNATFVLNNGTSITIGIQGIMFSKDTAKMAILKGF